MLLVFSKRSWRNDVLKILYYKNASTIRIALPEKTLPQQLQPIATLPTCVENINVDVIIHYQCRQDHSMFTGRTSIEFIFLHVCQVCKNSRLLNSNWFFTVAQTKICLELNCVMKDNAVSTDSEDFCENLFEILAQMQ